MAERGEIQYFVLPDPDHPHLLACVRWPDVFHAISPVRPEWQDDPGLFDLPYSASSTAVSEERAKAIATEWGAALPVDDDARRRVLMRRMPADWSNLSRAERQAWALDDVANDARRVVPKRSRWYRRRRTQDVAPPSSDDAVVIGNAIATNGNGNGRVPASDMGFEVISPDAVIDVTVGEPVIDLTDADGVVVTAGEDA